MAALIGIGILLFGVFLLTVSGIWGTLLAFQESTGWGLLYLLIPLLGALAFVVRKWRKQTVQTSFLFGVLGLLLVLGGAMVGVVHEEALVSHLKVNPDGAETSLLSATTNSDVSSAVNSAGQTGQPTRTYKQTMSIGYAAYNQEDYQTALINFRRALEFKPGDRLATEAIQNTEAIIQQQQ
ncbi:MAG: tetratricopeptide repeat protein [Leptolyngbyaceae bacterium]|nr:tetratricopeptide repeat protein [Leptolyngbyaceae bacterium]